MKYGLNRNILECKFKKSVDMGKEDISLNRNILECKSTYIAPLLLTLPLVLIETYWNVNTVTGLALALGFTS